MDEEIAQMIVTWREKLRELIEGKYEMSSCTYNADQTGLFYAKSPKYLYVNPQENKWYKGYKKMKYKTIFTEMVCNAADGNRVPIALISKFKEPNFFNYYEENPHL